MEGRKRRAPIGIDPKAFAKASDGPTHSSYYQKMSGHDGYLPYTLRRKDFIYIELSDLPAVEVIGITNDLVLQTSDYAAS